VYLGNSRAFSYSVILFFLIALTAVLAWSGSSPEYNLVSVAVPASLKGISMLYPVGLNASSLNIVTGDTLYVVDDSGTPRYSILLTNAPPVALFLEQGARTGVYYVYYGYSNPYYQYTVQLGDSSFFTVYHDFSSTAELLDFMGNYSVEPSTGTLELYDTDGDYIVYNKAFLNQPVVLNLHAPRAVVFSYSASSSGVAELDLNQGNFADWDFLSPDCSDIHVVVNNAPANYTIASCDVAGKYIRLYVRLPSTSGTLLVKYGAPNPYLEYRSNLSPNITASFTPVQQSYIGVDSLYIGFTSNTTSPLSKAILVKVSGNSIAVGYSVNGGFTMVDSKPLTGAFPATVFYGYACDSSTNTIDFYYIVYTMTGGPSTAVAKGMASISGSALGLTCPAYLNPFIYNADTNALREPAYLSLLAVLKYPNGIYQYANGGVSISVSGYYSAGSAMKKIYLNQPMMIKLENGVVNVYPCPQCGSNLVLSGFTGYSLYYSVAGASLSTYIDSDNYPLDAPLGIGVVVVASPLTKSLTIYQSYDANFITVSETTPPPIEVPLPSLPPTIYVNPAVSIPIMMAGFTAVALYSARKLQSVTGGLAVAGGVALLISIPLSVVSNDYSILGYGITVAFITIVLDLARRL